MDYVGYVDEVNRYYVSGWVADRDDWSTSLKVDIFVNGEGHGVCIADGFRDRLVDALPAGSTGRYAFKFYFAAPLSMYHDQQVTVRVNKTTFYLVQQCPPLSAIKGDQDSSPFRPRGPVLVTTVGRTGSTAVMAALSQHPNIVVAGQRPYEVELGCYYAHALRTLAASGDHNKSLRTDAITAVENRFRIGFNPYFDPSFASVFKDRNALRHFLGDRLPGRLGSTFREIILDYYEKVAADQGIEHPIYFAEKSLPERDSRLGVRFMFPNIREILLIRDLRDVVCSAMRSNGSDFDKILATTQSAAHRLVDIQKNITPGTMVLKYEDFVLDRDRTIPRIFDFLGLSVARFDEQRMGSLFEVHGTSSSPEASIGRWTHDLSAEQKGMMKVFRPFLEAFQYPE